MGFEIQIVPGKAEARAVVPGVPGRADNAARDDLDSKSAFMIRGTRPEPGSTAILPLIRDPGGK
jgi:hypothetical protein